MKMEKTALGDLHMGECARMTADETAIAKPRNACTEHAWQAFLLALKSAGLRDIPGFVTVLTETDVSHIEKRILPCDTDAAGAERYYRRCGCLLCLAWLMGAYDLHADNLMADGDMPVAVDLETLMSGTVARHSEYYAQSLACSVTATHLLPHFTGLQDMGGLTGDNGANRPRVNGQPVQAREYLAQLLAGFEETFHFVLGHKEFVCAELERFADCQFRVILRPTRTYQSLLEHLAKKQEAERRQAADALLRIAYEKDIDPNRVRHAALSLEAETTALCSGWIPLFYVKGAGIALYSDGRQLGRARGEVMVMDDYLDISPIERTRERIHALTPNDLTKQEAIIRTTYHAKEPLSEETASRAPLSRELARYFILDLPSGFMYLTADGDQSYWSSIGWGLYEGVTGILCALAAAGEERSELFRLLYAQLTEAMERSGSDIPLSPESCALSNGTAGVIAGLTHVSELTGNAAYREAASRLLSGIVPKVNGKASYDLLTGLGGICLQLPKFPGEHAARLAEALLPVMSRAELPLTGAAHGNAGLALALGALQTALQTNALDERILYLLRAEDALFDEKVGNWPDLRRREKPGFMGGWCAGAPGIGMTRRKLMEYTENEEIRALCRADMQRTATYLANRKPLIRDTLCCGNASRVMAASCLGLELPETLAVASRSLDPASPHLCHPAETADRNPTLMQGASGIAYALKTYGNLISGAMLL